MFVQSVKGEWASAAKYAKILADTCSWSPCSNTYQYACFLYAENQEKNCNEDTREIDDALRYAD